MYNIHDKFYDAKVGHMSYLSRGVLVDGCCLEPVILFSFSFVTFLIG